MAAESPQSFKEDPEVTQAAIAYINWRCAGGQGDWEPFKRQWLQERAETQKRATNGTEA